MLPLKTRCTPRTQTSAAPSLRGAKQTSQSWNSLTNFFLCPYPAKLHESPSNCYSILLLRNTDPENRKINLVFKGLNASSPNVADRSSGHNGPILKISWKSIDLFFRNVAHIHTTAARWETVKQSNQARNSLDHYFSLCAAWHIMKISWKSVHPFSHNTNKRGSRK